MNAREARILRQTMGVEEFNEKFAPKPKVTRFSDRMFTLTGYKLNGETIVINNVSMNNRNRQKIALKKLGYYRVDMIETNTTVNEKIGKEYKSRRMEFAQQIFAAANNKFVPKAIEIEKKSETQTTFAWDLLDNQDNAWLDNRPIVKVADRNAKVKAARKRLEVFNKINQNVVDAMKIYDRATGMIMFSSTNEDAILNYIEDNNLSLEDIILYVNNETYWQLVGMEK